MKRFFAIWVLISLMIGEFGLTEALARTRPSPPPRPNRPVPSRPAQPPRPRPDRPLPPPRPRPERPRPPRPNPVRPVRPLPPRPVYPYPPRYPNYNYNDARRSGWGLLWGLPVLAALSNRQPDINITVQESSSAQQTGSVSTSDVETLAAELKAVVEKDPVDKLKAMEIYSQIRATSQKIADENFSAYLKTVNDVPPGENFNAPMEIPDNVSPEMRDQMLELQRLAQELRDGLRRRPVDKVKAIDLYATVRRKGQAIADDRFYDYLSSLR